MFGLMRQSAIYPTPKKSATHNLRNGVSGRRGGKTKTRVLSISSAKITSFSTASSFRLCSKPMAHISCRITYRAMSSLISKEIKSPHPATGRFGSMSIWTISLVSKTSCAMSSQPMHRRLKITTLRGPISKRVTITNSWLSMVTSLTAHSY